MLQWGHDLLIVEGVFEPSTPSPKPLLQWGHDLLIVEGGADGTRSTDATKRFNGATIC